MAERIFNNSHPIYDAVDLQAPDVVRIIEGGSDRSVRSGQYTTAHQAVDLTDFRAFPGPAPAHFDLDGKNLLVYGENGSASHPFSCAKRILLLKPAEAARTQERVLRPAGN